MLFDPELATLYANERKLVPPSVERSMFTLLTIPVEVQVTFIVVPAAHVCPPFGAVTVMMFVGVIGRIELRGME